MYQVLTVQRVWIFISPLDGSSRSPYPLPGLFFCALVMKIDSENVQRGWTVRQNSICQRVSGCTVASLLACWPPCSLSRAWFVPSRSCCTSALQKETHSTLYIIKFRTVTYTNLDYPMLLCNFARPHLSTPKVLDLSHAETEKQMYFTAAAASWGPYMNQFILHAGVNKDQNHRHLIMMLKTDPST